MRALIWFGLTAALSLLSREASAQRTTSGEPHAFVSDSAARFVFPLDSRGTYKWDLPLEGAYPAMPEFIWDVNWNWKPAASPKDPIGLSMVARWKPGGPHKGRLLDLIRRQIIDIVTDCGTCDGGVIVTAQRRADSVFATVERNRLVFNVRGREAVHRVFPTFPDTVFFVTSVRQKPQGKYGPGAVGSTQGVIVNCVPSANREHPHSCVVKPVVAQRPPDADSAAAENAPRRVHVPVIRFQNATLLKDVRVRVKTIYGKVWRVLSTGSIGNVLINQAPAGPLLIEALCPRSPDGRTAISGTAFVNVMPRQDTSVHLWSDPTVCPH